MDIADRMLTPIPKVRTLCIMDRDASVSRQDPDGVQSLVPATGMHLIMGEPSRTGHMHPVSLLRHMHAGFILMDDFCLPEGFFDLCFHLTQVRGTAFDKSLHGGLTHRDAHQVMQDVTHAPAARDAAAPDTPPSLRSWVRTARGLVPLPEKERH